MLRIFYASLDAQIMLLLFIDLFMYLYIYGYSPFTQTSNERALRARICKSWHLFPYTSILGNHY